MAMRFLPEPLPGGSPIAHVRAEDGQEQSLSAHGRGVSRIAEKNALLIGLPLAAGLIGLIHDWGKASAAFQVYLKSATGRFDQDHDDYVDATRLKGRIDHSTAAAQWIWRTQPELKRFAARQVLALCLCSHHSGLIDCLDISGANIFQRRLDKEDDKSNLTEVLSALASQVLEAEKLLGPALAEVDARIRAIRALYPEQERRRLGWFEHGLLTRMLFSCLIDADRFDSAAFETPRILALRSGPPDWTALIERLEKHLATFPSRGGIDATRRHISEACRSAASENQGLFTLTVPTGGGKTLAGLRFALHHAHHHGMARIINVIPYTSIIDQNAHVAREILEPEGVEANSIVLEHHSNLEPERDNWASKHLGEAWDAPVIYVTLVQVLEALFGGGTRGVRRLNRLAGAVVIFDEIQTLPVACIHLFCNAVNMLTRECGASVVLCTATQPLLDSVSPMKGCLAPTREIMGDVPTLFCDLERVEIIDHSATAMDETSIAALAEEEFQNRGNCLVIVNTKRWAMRLYLLLSARHPDAVFHLSTDMCAAHRMEVLNLVRTRLKKGEPTLCLSTQLIEAGVDIDFRVVLRFLAGLDSIAQAAGRCNRNGAPEPGRVHIVTPESENLDKLPDIRIGKQHAADVLRWFRGDPASLGGSLLSPAAMQEYYRRVFHARAGEMSYRIDGKRQTTLLDMLSDNLIVGGTMGRTGLLRQSFMEAGRRFQPIDAATEGVIVPYGAGREIIAALQAEIRSDERRALLRQAQRYSVALFPWRKQILLAKQAIHPVIDSDEAAEILVLDERHYHAAFGLSDEPAADLPILLC